MSVRAIGWAWEQSLPPLEKLALLCDGDGEGHGQLPPRGPFAAKLETVPEPLLYRLRNRDLIAVRGDEITLHLDR